MKTTPHRRLFQLLMVSLLVFCWSTTHVYASSHHGTCGDNVEWTLTDGILTFYGSGPMQDFGWSRPWRERNVKEVVIKEGITRIGNRTFEDCVKLTKISMPSTLESIGDSAFYDCYGLTKVVLPNSVKEIGNGCFWFCKNMTTLVLSNQLEYVGQLAFFYCQQLQYITLPNSVRFVGSEAFRECRNLTILIVPDEPFETNQGKALNLSFCGQLSLVRGNHTLCPEYMYKYIPKNCPFMIEGNPRREYAGTIKSGKKVIVPALREYTADEAIDEVEAIFREHFNMSNPCIYYDKTQQHLSKLLTMLEYPVYKQVLDHYYDAFIEAGRKNRLEAASMAAFKHLMLGGRDDEELMWNIIITRYGQAKKTDNTRFLMGRFKDISMLRQDAYQATIDSLTTVYYNVLFPETLRDMSGYWVSINDTTPEGTLTDAPEHILHIADITNPAGAMILSSPKCEWKAKKSRYLWNDKTHDDKQLRYSYSTGFNSKTGTMRLLFNSQSKKIANPKAQQQALDLMQDFEATMKASLEQFQKELNYGLAHNYTSWSKWGAGTAIGVGIGIGVQLLTIAVIAAIIYSSNIETAEKYEILLTPLAPNVMDVSVRYAYARFNYNNGNTKHQEDTRHLTFVKWEESDSTIFVSKDGKPIFIGDDIETFSPLLNGYNASHKKANYQLINRNSIEKLRQKAELMLQAQERKQAANAKKAQQAQEAQQAKQAKPGKSSKKAKQTQTAQPAQPTPPANTEDGNDVLFF